MEAVLRDVRFALRSFARRKLIAAGAIASLAIAIAANTSVFVVANALLFKAVPGVMRTDRLVEISRDVAGEASDVTFSIFRHLRAQTTVLDDLAAYSLEAVSFSAGDDPGLRGAVVVTGNYFSMLGVAAARGRLSYRVVLYQTSHRGTP